MIVSMLLAHLIGDYILQWDELAMWKSQKVTGVLVHGFIVTVVTFLFVLPFNPLWWQGALFISVCHIIIDLTQLPLTKRGANGMFPLLRFTADQLLHFLVIVIALNWGGYFDVGDFWTQAIHELITRPIMMIALAYTALAMPAWVILEFTGYGLIQGTPPDFSRATNKYLSSLERWLIATSVVTGQFLLIPIIAAPRFYFEHESIIENREATIYVTKLLGSIGLAVVAGLFLRNLL